MISKLSTSLFHEEVFLHRAEVPDEISVLHQQVQQHRGGEGVRLEQTVGVY